MPHIRLPRFSDEERHATGRSRELPNRNQARHGASLKRELNNAIRENEAERANRPANLPPLPDQVQLILKSATTASGKPLLEREAIPKGWKLEVVEQRRDGSLVTLSRDPKVSQLEAAIEHFRLDERTSSGRRKAGVRPVFELEEVTRPQNLDKMGDELALTTLAPAANYLVDVEVAAGRETEDGEQRRNEFGNYLRNGHAQIIGNGPRVGNDYAVYRVRASGAMVTDMLNSHPFVSFVDLPPVVEREGIELHNIDEPNLPNFRTPAPDDPVVTVIDAGLIPQQPLIEPAVRDQRHRSFIGGTTLDGGQHGHGTAITSIVALGSLREALLVGPNPNKPVRVLLTRLLDDQTLVPQTAVVHEIIPSIATYALQEHNSRVFNHSVASRAPFNRARMSVWAEMLDDLTFDNGGEGFLFIVASGNIDGQLTPTLAQVNQWTVQPGHPTYLLEERCRLRNPSQAINALTVGAYVPVALANFHQAQAFGYQPVAQNSSPSPFTRTGLGFLDEIKPEVVEEGGNWYLDDGNRLVTTRPQYSDVAVANAFYATEGRLVRFTTGTSVAAAKVSHLCGRISEQLPGASVDLIRALVVCSATWPQRLGSLENTVRLFGYGVPDPKRALNPGGERCLIVIEDEIQIGHAQFFRIPFPTNLFDANPELMLRVSVCLSFRPPVRKTNAKYRGTILEWNFSKRDEALAQFRKRCATKQSDENDEGIEEQPIGDWNWTIGKRLRTRGTAQKDWFEAAAADFSDELFFAVIGRRGWLSKEKQDEGFSQRYAVAISIEVIGAAIPIHEEIEARVRVPIRP